MRTILYTVFNKTANKRVYTNCNLRKCKEKLNTLDNKENFEIRYKWVSF